jgi:hypothetical protein
MKLSTMFAAIAGISLQAAVAAADPLAYRCEIFDYTADGVERTEYLYTQQGTSQAFHSDRSTGRIYLDESGRLTISIRPKDQSAGQYFYSTVNGYNLPERLDVVIANGINAYAARLDCER